MLRTINYQLVSTPFGKVIIAATERGVCYLGFANNQTAGLKLLRKQLPQATLVAKNTPILKQAIQVLQQKQLSKIKLDLTGTPFQKKVWTALLHIPQGHTTTYGAIAKQIDHPNAFRAVGTAVGANPVCYFVPCHRVLPSTGGLGHYHWGSKIKAQMLTAEGVHVK